MQDSVCDGLGSGWEMVQPGEENSIFMPLCPLVFKPVSCMVC